LVVAVVESLLADRIKALEGKPERIDLPVTLGAGRHISMLRKLDANRCGASNVRLQRIHIRRRGRVSLDARSRSRLNWTKNLKILLFLSASDMSFQKRPEFMSNF
jgi:hypothetical protein